MLAVIYAQLAQVAPNVDLGEQSKTSLGVALIALLLLVREFLNYLKSRDKAAAATDGQCEIENALAISVLPILNRQTEILSELKGNGVRQIAQADRMTFMLEENEKQLTSIRGGVHNANNALAVVVNDVQRKRNNA